MVKFSKQLEGQLIPEWKDAYCNYKQLKRDVNRVKQHHGIHGSFTQTGSVGLMRSLGTVTALANMGAKSKGTDSGKIMVHMKRDWHKGEVYETELLEPLAYAQQDKTFFTRLDAQLNKINHFYKAKETEYVEQACRLERQMWALFEMQEALARQGFEVHGFSSDMDECSTENGGHAGGPLLLQITVKGDDHYLLQNKRRPSTIKDSDGYSHEELQIITNLIENNRVSTDDRSDLEETESGCTASQKRNGSDSCNTVQFASSNMEDPSGEKHRPPFGVQKELTGPNNSDAYSSIQNETNQDTNSDDMNSRSENTRENQTSYSPSKIGPIPRSTIQDMIDMDLSKKNVRHAEKMLRTAFIEFYRGLGMLKSYSSLNMVAFAKILKKYDKVTRWNLAPLYIKEVERSYFASSDKITKLVAKVEDIFIKHFSESNRRKAMAELKPMQQHGGHSITFFLGLFSGCSAALLVAFCILFLSSPSLKSAAGKKYIQPLFHVSSALALVLLHMYMYGWNVYAWQRARINYAFIFEFSPRSDLRYREVLLVCTGSTTVLLAFMVTQVIASKDPSTSYASKFIPLVLVLVFLGLLLLPLNILYRSSRIFFLRCVQHIIFSPLYKVVLADFFLADQFTSQVAVFRQVEFILCYYSGGFFVSRDAGVCSENDAFQGLMYLFSLVPYWWRFLQCLRRWRDEGDRMQLYNAGKYLSAMVAVAIKEIYVSNYAGTWLTFFIISSIFATLYQLYWDLVIDWGLLQRKSTNPWLRDQLILKKKQHRYFISMGVNVILRLAWLSSIMRISIPGFTQQTWDLIFAAVEIIRRGHWNFYRLENEHLNNVGKYRAIKSMPLPFKEFDSGIVC